MPLPAPTSTGLFAGLAAGGTQLIIIGDTAQWLPSVITHIATLRADALVVVPKTAYQLIHSGTSGLPEAPIVLPAYLNETPPAVTPAGGAESGLPPLFRNLYPHGTACPSNTTAKSILDDITWTVKRGERWWLKGHNGAGKSTLLSLVVGDNPQAYANQHLPV